MTTKPLKSLRRCPFCGGPAEAVTGEYCISPTFQIRCAKCRSSSQVLIAGYNPHTGKVSTQEDIQVSAEQLWNRRAAV